MLFLYSSLVIFRQSVQKVIHIVFLLDILFFDLNSFVPILLFLALVDLVKQHSKYLFFFFQLQFIQIYFAPSKWTILNDLLSAAFLSQIGAWYIFFVFVQNHVLQFLQWIDKKVFYDRTLFQHCFGQYLCLLILDIFLTKSLRLFYNMFTILHWIWSWSWSSLSFYCIFSISISLV